MSLEAVHKMLTKELENMKIFCKMDTSFTEWETESYSCFMCEKNKLFSKRKNLLFWNTVTGDETWVIMFGRKESKSSIDDKTWKTLVALEHKKDYLYYFVFCVAISYSQEWVFLERYTNVKFCLNLNNCDLNSNTKANVQKLVSISYIVARHCFSSSSQRFSQ